MTTVNVFRLPARKFANMERHNEDVTTILENPDDEWSVISEKIKSVADMVPDDDWGPSTILGKEKGFMKPFIEALRMFRVQYSGSTWCHRTGNGSLEGLPNPFDTKKIGVDAFFATKHTIPPGDRAIVIGDAHSSIQSIARIFDHLVNKGIMSNNFVIASNYTIFYLGDLIDRGPYGLDILHLVFRMKVANPYGKVFILSGNHEKFQTYSRFSFIDEIQTQLENNPGYQRVVHELLTHLPSVLFLHINEGVLQLNHGGIDRNYNPRDFIFRSSCDYEFHAFDDGVSLTTYGLLWSDFNGNISGTQEGKRGPGILEYGKDATDEYLADNGLSGILRGHQDYHHCAFMSHGYSLSTRDTVPITDEDIGMTEPGTNRWGLLLDGGWEKIHFLNAFEDFSVVTTSTAVRARDLGYHAYLELTSDTEEIENAQNALKGDATYTDYIKQFWSQLGLGEEMETVLMDLKQVPDVSKRNMWNDAMYQIKQDRDNWVLFYPVLILDSYVHHI